MSTAEQFIADFRLLHEKAKGGTLSLDEKKKYTEARAQFGKMVMLAQMGSIGSTLRADFRMTKMLKVELRPDGAPPTKGSTIDLSRTGFAMLVGDPLKAGQGAGYTIHLPKPGGGGTAPINGRATVATVRPQGSLVRVTFKFEQLLPTAQEALDTALIDEVLDQLSRF